MESAVEKAGFKVKKNVKDYTFKIKGMSCSSCANRLERLVQKMEGIEGASVNFATEKLTIKLDADVTSYSQLKEVVHSAGFELLTDGDMKQQTTEEVSEAKRLLNRFIVSLIFSVPLLIISMGHMVGLPLPHALDPMMNPLNFGLILLF